MIHHERLRPPSHEYPADEWNVIEKGFHPEFLAQSETMLAVGNGYLGMRGCPDHRDRDRQQDHQALRRRRALLVAQRTLLTLRPPAEHAVWDTRPGDPLGDASR